MRHKVGGPREEVLNRHTVLVDSSSDEVLFTVFSKGLLPFFLILFLSVLTSQSATAFTLVLKSGQRIEGAWLGEKQSTILFRDTTNRVLSFDKSEIDYEEMARAFQSERGNNVRTSPGKTAHQPPTPETVADTLTSLRIKRSNAGVGIIFSGNGTFRVRSFELADPPRIVIDFHSVQTNSHGLTLGKPGQELFSQIRIAQHQNSPKVTRVVIDLNERVPFQVVADGPTITVALSEPAGLMASDRGVSAEPESESTMSVADQPALSDQDQARLNDDSTQNTASQMASPRRPRQIEASVSTGVDPSPIDNESRTDHFFQSFFDFESEPMEPFDDTELNRSTGSIRASYKHRLSRSFRVETEGEISRRLDSAGTEIREEYYLRPKFRYRLNRRNELQFYSIYQMEMFDYETDYSETTRSLGMAYVRKFGKDRFQLGYRYERHDSTWEEDDYTRWVYNAGYTLSWGKRTWTKVEVNYAPQLYDNRFVRGPTRGSRLQKQDTRWVVNLASVVSLKEGLDLIPGYRFQSKSSNGRVRNPAGHLPSLRLRYTW